MIKTVNVYCNSKKCCKWVSHKIKRVTEDSVLGNVVWLDIECSSCWKISTIDLEVAKKTNLETYV